MLTESHLACHTYPEFGVATFNLYCCRERATWPWEERLREMLGANGVRVRCLARTASPTAPFDVLESSALNTLLEGEA